MELLHVTKEQRIEIIRLHDIILDKELKIL